MVICQESLHDARSTKCKILFTGAHRMLLYWARRINSTPLDHRSLRTIFYLPAIYASAFQVHIFPSDFPTKTLHAFLFSTIRATYHDHLLCLDLTALILIKSGEVVAKLFFMHLSPLFSYNLPRRLKCLPQHLVPEHLSYMFFSYVRNVPLRMLKGKHEYWFYAAWYEVRLTWLQCEFCNEVFTPKIN